MPAGSLKSCAAIHQSPSLRWSVPPRRGPGNITSRPVEALTRCRAASGTTNRSGQRRAHSGWSACNSRRRIPCCRLPSGDCWMPSPVKPLSPSSVRGGWRSGSNLGSPAKGNGWWDVDKRPPATAKSCHRTAFGVALAPETHRRGVGRLLSSHPRQSFVASLSARIYENPRGESSRAMSSDNARASFENFAIFFRPSLQGTATPYRVAPLSQSAYTFAKAPLDVALRPTIDG